MKFGIGCLVLLTALGTAPAGAGITSFEHIVVIVQENRTPDNLFYALCTGGGVCSTKPNATQYNIQVDNWLNKNATGGVTQPVKVPLANAYDLAHTKQAYIAMCDRSSQAGPCLMDGAAGISCWGTCPSNPQFAYVDNSSGILNPYVSLAKSYGWANYMFQTNQGESFPAHQFLFGATSAPSAAADHSGIFASENSSGAYSGCAAPAGTKVQLIDANGVEDPNHTMFPCFEHATLADILTNHGFTWRYYASTDNTIWVAPDAIRHICVPSGQKCTGSAYTANVDVHSADVLSDIANCKLRNVSWITPGGWQSDHPNVKEALGPSWVASIVNAIGNSKCKDGANSYWNNTAILITWDDFGGWYDHVPPPSLAYPQGGYQYGFRVPFLFVSAYTPQGYIDNTSHDFGSIARFIEQNFLIQEGILTFADARSTTALLAFFHFAQQPRPFKTIPAQRDGNYFLNDKSPPLPPDND